MSITKIGSQFTKLAVDEWVKQLIRDDIEFKRKYIQLNNQGADYRTVLQAAREHLGDEEFRRRSGIGRAQGGYRPHESRKGRRAWAENQQRANQKRRAQGFKATVFRPKADQMGNFRRFGPAAAAGAAAAGYGYHRYRQNKKDKEQMGKAAEEIN